MCQRTIFTRNCLVEHLNYEFSMVIQNFSINIYLNYDNRKKKIQKAQAQSCDIIAAVY